jgi:hypothetical protein|tara:strand:+ start:608 stop:883 length:276 start_codon:yes stop_codon:yes gene_type:complete
MSKIPDALHGPINTAFPQNVCLVGSLREDGFANISPRGSVQVVDGDTLGIWDRGGRASSQSKGSESFDLSQKNRLTVIAALNNMPRNAGEF